MRLLKNKTFQSYLILIVFLMFIEIMFRFLSGTKIFNLGLLRNFFFLNIMAILFGYLTSLLKGKLTYIVNSILILMVTVYAFMQMGFNHFLGVYISLNTTSQFESVKEYIYDYFKSFKPNYYLIFLPFIILIITLIISNIIKKKHSHLFQLKKYFRFQKGIDFVVCAIFIILFSFAFSFSLTEKFSFDNYQVLNVKELFLNSSNPSMSVKEFGILPYFFSDTRVKLMGKKENNITYLAYTPNTSNTTDTNREFDDTLWNNIIANESNESLNNLNNYFKASRITNKNEYTGYFEDKNVIVILMESVNDIIYNEKYFPNFYKMTKNSWYFTNNYSPRNSCATGNNEFSSITGLYSIYNTCTTNMYEDNKYFESLFNLFNNKDYDTSSYHNYTEQYYYRETSHLNYGSKKYYGVETLGIPYSDEYGEWSSDEDLMKKYLEILDEKDKSKPFMSYITTVTSHQPYYDSSYYGDLYLDMTSDTNYSIDIRRYLSKLKVVDNALGILIDGLKERKLLDDTVIVLLGDHYPYGLSNELLQEVLTRSLDNYEVEKVPLMIYNPSLEAKTIDTYTSYINLTPTLANLFDLDFDPRLYSGVDIFDDEYNGIVVFPDYSWKSKDAFYNANLGTIDYYSDKVYTDEEIININSYFYTKINSSAIAIENNYFDYLDTKLKELKERGVED